MNVKKELIKKLGPQNFYRVLHFAGMCTVAIVTTFMMNNSYACGYKNGAQDMSDYVLEHPDILSDKEN